MRRCLSGHVIVDEDGNCSRCFSDYGGGVNGGLSLKKDTPKPTKFKPLTPNHHAKKNVSQRDIDRDVLWFMFKVKPTTWKKSFKGVRIY